MTNAAPPIDTRTASDVTAQIKTLLKAYAPAYAGLGTDPATGEVIPDPLGGALIGIFGRLSELIIQRLNRVPDKNFLAFLDLLGASQLPPQPARVPLTFSLAAGSVVPAVVPEETQVAAPPGPGEKDPIVFETEHEFVVSPATLTAAFSRDPEVDAYADLRALATVTGASAQGAVIFRGDRLIDHILYLGFRDLLGFSGIQTFQVSFVLAENHTDPRETFWEAWDGSEWTSMSAGGSGTTGPQDGTTGLQEEGSVDFGAIAPVPLTTVQGVESRWLRCRLETPINRSTATRAGMVRASELPIVQSITATVHVNRSNLRVDAAFTNGNPIDTTKEFFPFGEAPRFGDTFFLRADEPFSAAGADVTIHFEVVNPAVPSDTPPTSPPATTPHDLTLAWEIWNGSIWSPLGTSTADPPGAGDFSDKTQAFTKSGDVTFKVPSPVSATTVNGLVGYWLRVRIAAGHYGQDAHYVEDRASTAGFKLVLADFAPPIVGGVQIGYSLTKSAVPDTVLTYNDFTLAEVPPRRPVPFPVSWFAPFVEIADERPTVYLGFDLPTTLKASAAKDPNRAFPNRPVSVFVRSADIRYGERPAPLWPSRTIGAGIPGSVVTHQFTVTNPDPTPISVDFAVLGTAWVPTPVPPPATSLAGGEAKAIAVSVTVPPGTPLGVRDAGVLAVTLSTDPKPKHAHVASFVTVAGLPPEDGDPVKLVWEYWNGMAWSTLTIQESTDSLTQSGTVEFLAPPDFSARTDFGLDARYWIRVRWEKGTYARDPRVVRLLLNTTMAAQTVTLRNEVVGSSDGAKNLRFRATRAPILPGQRLEVREPELPAAAELATLVLEEGADAIPPDARNRLKDMWVRWHEVPDFHASRPRDRHYVLDRLSGGIRFGDGLNGLVPPTGIGNVRLLRYQTGGGRAGNRPAGVIVQLKTTVPYVDKVTNHEAATGGADAEPLDLLLARAPREVRHGGRAVTLEDYEDLAHLASPDVARAKSVPLANLVIDPLSQQPAVRGDVSVIIVPRSTEAKPLPSLELIRRVKEYLEAVAIPTVRLSVVGPVYVRVDVEAEVALVSLEGATRVLADIQQRVASFLHPLTGGLDGEGWDFGRRPYESDFYALIEKVPGVDHVRSLDVNEEEDLPGVKLTGRFLVYSGTPNISVIFEEA